MIASESFWLRISIVILNFLSILGCLAILWTFIKVPHINQNPGNIVKRITVFQLLYSIMLLLGQFYYVQDNTEKLYLPAAIGIQRSSCDYIIFLTVLISGLFNLYNVWLTINIVMILERQGDIFNKSFCKLEVVSFIIVLSVSIILIKYRENKDTNADCAFHEIKSVGLLISFLGSVLFFLVMTMIAFLLWKLNRDDTQTPMIYQAENSEILSKKQLKQYILINSLYSVVFLITRLFPYLYYFFYATITMRDSSLSDQEEMLLVGLTSIGGLLLFIIRSREPVVRKHINKMLGIKKGIKLVGRLNLRRSSSTLASGINDNLMKKDSLEITLYQDYTRPVTQDIASASIQAPSFIKKANDLLFAIRSAGEFMRILIGINYCFQENQTQLSSNIIQSKTPIRPYLFNQITHIQIPLKLTNKELDRYLKANASVCHKTSFEHLHQGMLDISIQNNSDNSLCNLSDFIDNEQTIQTPHPQKQILQIFQYGAKTLNRFLASGFNISLSQLKTSLEISTNILQLMDLDLVELNKFGTIFVTSDGLISIDLITTAQKKRLIREHGLMKMFQHWRDAQTRTEDQYSSSTILPAIIGLFSIQLDQKRFGNVLVKLNQVRLQYPLSERVWEKKLWHDMFTKHNIIGWVQLNREFYTTRYKATSFQDGKFKVELQAEDFKLTQEDQLKVIQILQNDLPLINQVCYNVQINFVFFKFSSQRLFSIYQHEKNKDEYPEILKAPEEEADLSLRCSKGSQKYIGKFALDSKIGYVKVFFDDLWIMHETPQPEDSVEKLITLVNEII